MRIFSRIIGTGSYLPENRLTNADLAAQLAQQGVETSDDWIVERTGIRARHFAPTHKAAVTWQPKPPKTRWQRQACRPMTLI